MKINHVLFPVDFSKCSEALKPEVEWLADRFDAKITLLHVFEVPVSWYGTGEAPVMNAECLEAFRESQRQRLRDFSINVPTERLDRVIAEGDPGFHIPQWATDNNVDLIVMGTHGYGTVRRLILGCVAMEVLHNVDIPVCTHSPETSYSNLKRGVTSVVCAIEPGVEAVPLLRFTRDVAEQFGASVLLVHAVPEIETRSYRYFDLDLHRYLKECAAKEIAKAQTEAGTDFQVSITDGAIAEDVAAAARDQNAELLIIGRGKVQATFGGIRTHAYEMIRHAPCAVLSYAAEHGTARHPSTETGVADLEAVS